MSNQKSHEKAEESAPVIGRITEVLRRVGLAYADVDRALGFSEGYFSKIVTGQRRLTKRHVREIALLTHVDPASLEQDKGGELAVEDQATYHFGDAPPLRFCPYCGHKLPGFSDEKKGGGI
jgi:hypothetical protein